MNTETLTKQLSFQEKLMERIKESIGDLMTDDDLRKIVDRGVEAALFERRTVERGWNNREQVPSLVDTLVETHLKERMTAAVDQWLKDNPEKIQQAIDDAVKLGAAGCLISAMDARFSGIFQMGVKSLQAQRLLPESPYPV